MFTEHEFPLDCCGELALANSAALPPVSAAIVSASVGGFGVAAAAAQAAGMTKTDGAGLAKLTCLVSRMVCSGAFPCPNCAFMTRPVFGSTHPLTFMPCVSASYIFVATPLTVSVPVSLAPFPVISVSEANGSPQFPEKLDLPQPLSGLLRSHVRLLCAARS